MPLYCSLQFPLPNTPLPPSRTDPRSVAAGLGGVGGANLQYGWAHDSGDDFETAIVYGKYMGQRKFFRAEVRGLLEILQIGCPIVVNVLRFLRFRSL